MQGGQGGEQVVAPVHLAAAHAPPMPLVSELSITSSGVLEAGSQATTSLLSSSPPFPTAVPGRAWSPPAAARPAPSLEQSPDKSQLARSVSLSGREPSQSALLGYTPPSQTSPQYMGVRRLVRELVNGAAVLPRLDAAVDEASHLVNLRTVIGTFLSLIHISEPTRPY